MNGFEEELQSVLIAMQPAVDWSTALHTAGLDGPDVWHREDPDLWPMSDPPEEYALPPLVLWGDDLRLLAERAYRLELASCGGAGRRQRVGGRGAAVDGPYGG